MKPIYDFLARLKEHSFKIVITTHHKPDADAVGSSLGLASVLKKLGHQVAVIFPNRPASYLQKLPLFDTSIIYEEQTDLAKVVVEDCDWILALDYNSFQRTKTMKHLLSASSKPKVLIDHHLLPQKKFFTYGISNTRKSSTSEMVYDLIQAMNSQHALDLPTMELIYAGIIGDTGSFAFASTTVNTFKIAADFKERGLATHRVYEQLYQSNSLKKIKFSSYAITNLMETLEQECATLIAIPLDTYNEYQLSSGDLEGLVNIPLSAESVSFSALAFALSENQTKWSFRSLGNIDVNTFARNYFDGGGHLNAAGGLVSQNLIQSIALLKEKIHQLKL